MPKNEEPELPEGAEDDSIDEGKSTFHGGMLKVGRLDFAWQDCYNARKSNHYSEWKLSLDFIASELSARMTAPQIITFNNLLRGKTGVVITLMKALNTKNTTQELLSDAYTILGEYERFLRRIEASQGFDVRMGGKFDITEGL